MEDKILAVLQEKLEHLEYQLAVLADPAQKFTLEKQISECKEEIAKRTANRVDEPKEPLESDTFRVFRERVRKEFGDHRLSKTKEIKLKQVKSAQRSTNFIRAGNSISGNELASN